uniref:VPS37 C-terminal domain-containing protein n=1 Tax=Pinguiococcus pyrenoidosus TaxID=172671 RepID=A0A7R9YA95_9STRA|mmetsp:Transcript_15549/g.59105  ORF Transcript_15549/g.59105 Transcript_15549/m.59105 type:complete len:197 (+) Transcript_15549:205-795(+)|eukprot:scaffold1878_cov258-Pinguiococcus_pyrenoidosus.AAC.3
MMYYPSMASGASGQDRPATPSEDVEHSMNLETLEQYHTPMPAVPAKYPLLEEMSTAEQQRLLDDEVALEAFVNELDVVKSYRQLLEDTREANLKAARGIVEREDELLTLRDNCLILQSELREKARAYEILAKSTELSEEQVEDQLQAAVVKAEEEKEDAGMRLEDGSDVREWLEDFVEKAATFHRLNALREVLAHS